LAQVADREDHLVAAGDLAQLLDVRAGHFDRVVEQTPIERVLIDRRVKHIPEGEGGDVGLAEDHEISPALFCLGHPALKVCNCGFAV
jgi:hypothetical protein